jgi:hypothetical protein
MGERGQEIRRRDAGTSKMMALSDGNRARILRPDRNLSRAGIPCAAAMAKTRVNPATIKVRVKPGHDEGLCEINQADPVGD